MTALQMDQAKILDIPVILLPLSEGFKAVMASQDINTLGEIMRMPLTELVNLKWFTTEILEELSEFLFRLREEATDEPGQ